MPGPVEPPHSWYWPNRILESAGKFAPAVLLACGVLASLGAITFVTGIGIGLARSDIANVRGDEQYFVSGVVKILSGRSPFTEPSEPPYLLTGYTPAAYYATASWVRIFGPGTPSPVDVMRAGRTLAVGMTLAHAVLLLYFMWRCFGSRLPVAIIGCGIVYSIRMPWGFVVRPDPLYSVLFLLSILSSVLSLDSKRTTAQGIALSIVAGTTSAALFMTKQTGVQLPIIAVAFHLVSRDWRRFVSYSLGFAAPFLAAVLWFPVWLGPDWASSMFLTNASGVNVENALRKVFGPVLIREGGAILISMAIPAWIAWTRGETDERCRFLAWATIGAMGFSCLTAFSSGSAEHYFNDSLTLVVVCLAAYWGGPADGARHGAALRHHVDCVTGAFAVLFLPLFLHPNASAYLHSSDRFETRENVRDELRRRLEQFPEATFITVDNALANFFLDRAVVPQFQYAAVFRQNGAIDLSGLQKSLDDGSVRWCLVGTDQDLNRQLGFLGLDAAHFIKESTIDGFAFWVYRN